MPFWLDALFKGTTLLIVLFGLATVLRRSCAAMRHLLWCFGLLGLLALPAVSIMIPWHLPVLPPVEGAVVREPIPTSAPEAVAADEARSGTLADATGAETTGRPHAASPTSTPDASRNTTSADPGTAPALRERASQIASGIGLPGALAALWALGVLAILGRLGIGMGALRSYSRRARPAAGAPWEEALEWTRRRLLVDTPVRLLVSDEVAMPLTAGVLRPVILLPAEAERWPDERRRAVLLHEMAHVKRRDVVPHLLGWLVCALWWFHPLAWSATQRMRSESERACDDLVLKVGTRPSRYADDLLDIVTRAGTGHVPAAVVPFAQRSEFEGRILAILEPERRRHGVSVAQAALAALAVGLFALPLAAVGPGNSDPTPMGEAVGKPDAGSVGERLADLAGVGEKKGGPSEVDPGERMNLAGEENLEKDRIESRVEEETSTELSTDLDTEADTSTAPEIVIAEELARQKKVQSKDRFATDGRAAAGLAARLRDDDPLVRRTAAEALGKLEDPRVVQALAQALRQDPDAKVRAMAAWALGQIEDPAAVPPLSAALREDDDVTVRKQAAWALGEIEDAAAIGALGDALRDPGVEVRRTAVWALGMIEDARAVPLVLPFLQDEDVEVRRKAAEALGDIESSQAVDALIQATRDNDTEVRLNAMQALGNIEDARALPALIAALGDESVVVRREAIDAIGELDVSSAPREVIDAVHDPDREVRLEAVDALGSFEDPSAVPVLVEIVNTSTDRELQYEALEALSDIESPVAYDALIPLLQHEDPKIRQLAAQAIGNMQ